jgi:arginine decarboxylase
MFLTGAYQDIMGDFHNLFGRVNEVHVFLDESEPGGYYIEETIPGSSVAGVLSWTQYGTSYLVKGMKSQIDQKIRDSTIKPRKGSDILKYYESVLAGYTYMDTDREAALSSVLAPGAPMDQAATKPTEVLQ